MLQLKRLGERQTLHLQCSALRAPNASSEAFGLVGSEHCSEHCLFRTSVPNTGSEPPPGPPEPQKDLQNHPSGGSGGLGGGSGGPGGGSETVSGTDVLNRQCS